MNVSFRTSPRTLKEYTSSIASEALVMSMLTYPLAIVILLGMNKQPTWLFFAAYALVLMLCVAISIRHHKGFIAEDDKLESANIQAYNTWGKLKPAKRMQFIEGTKVKYSELLDSPDGQISNVLLTAEIDD